LLASRAIGEQGIAAFLLSDIGTAKKEVLKAWMIAKVQSFNLGNILAVAHARPNATHVAGISTWNELGRFVNKGEGGFGTASPEQWVLHDAKNPALDFRYLALLLFQMRIEEACERAVGVGTTQPCSDSVGVVLMAITALLCERPVPQGWVHFHYRRFPSRDLPGIEGPKMD
jgi:hypothetical protein